MEEAGKVFQAQGKHEQTAKQENTKTVWGTWKIQCGWKYRILIGRKVKQKATIMSCRRLRTPALREKVECSYLIQ